jgi:GMP synthase (glutamine-hydrolysing)
VTILVLDHSSPGGLGAYAAALQRAGVTWDTVRPYTGQRLPDWAGYDGIIALGGPMGAGDDLALPWIADEKRWIADAVRAGVSFWGVCLGAQLLAASLGAAVYRGAVPEVGIHRITLTPAGLRDPVLSALPAVTDAMQWHRDTFELPAGAVLLARSRRFAHQAYRLGSNAYAVQFHLELSARSALKWREFPGYQGVLRKAEQSKMISVPGRLEAQEPQMQALASEVLTRWLERARRGAGVRYVLPSQNTSTSTRSARTPANTRRQ